MVPVLPAAGLSSASAWAKPPGSMTPRRMSLTASAVEVFSTWRHLAGYCLSTLPLASSIEVTGREAQCVPRAANVAYASAISSGLTLATPSGNEGTISLFLSVSRTPIFLASR